MAEISYALSLKQPWAALLASGRKTIEVRRWSTARRGRILIHAARVSATEPFAWEQVPAELRERAALVGGIIGVGELTECVAYRSAEAFANDRGHHLNDPAWFQSPVLYGFKFVNLQTTEFRPYPGWMRFFPVTEQLPVRTGAGK